MANGAGVALGGGIVMPGNGAVMPASVSYSQNTIDASNRLIVALDVPTIGKAYGLVDELEGTVSFFKIGLHLQMAEGAEGLTTDLIKRGKQVFVDYKWTDIPQSVRGGVLAAAARGVHFITIQGNGDVTEEMLRAAVQARDEGNAGSNGVNRVKLFFVTVLTSLDDTDMNQLGMAPVNEMVYRRASMAYKIGLDGVIASGREAQMIKEKVVTDSTRDFLVVTPGIRPAGLGADDHKRPTTPTDAIGGGADYLVVGRPILQANERLKAAEEIIAEMQAAFDAR